MLNHLQPSPIAPLRVVLLGATGFISRALTAHLAAARIPLRAVGRGEVDLTAAAAASALAGMLQSTDAVVMAAALTPDKGRDVATLMRNLRMAENVAAAIAARPVAHLVYLSSDAVYGWDQPLISETTAPSPTDLYSVMHLTRERMLAAATGATQTPYCILRPCAVYGPGDTHNSYGPNRFVRTALAEGRIQLFGGGEETRDHVCIDDVAAIINRVLNHRSTGILNLASGRSATFAAVADAIARMCPRPVRVESLPRSSPITHRHFDALALHQAFPDHRPTLLDAGLPSLLGQP